MSRRLLLYLFAVGVFLLPVSPLHARERVQGWCEQGGNTLTVAGLETTDTAQQSFPGCTVTVWDAGTTDIASIFSDDVGTIKANPFTADSTTGLWFFYADNARYDVQLSGAGIAAPFTLADFSLDDSAQTVTAIAVVASSATPVFDVGKASILTNILTANVTSSTITNGVTGQTVTIYIAQDGTGGWTFAWPASVQLRKGGYTVSDDANAVSVIDLYFDGTNWRETNRGADEIGYTLTPVGAILNWANTLAPLTTGQDIGTITARPDGIFNVMAVGEWNGMQVVDGNKNTTVQAAHDACPAAPSVCVIYVPFGDRTLPSKLTLSKPFRLFANGGTWTVTAGSGVTEGILITAPNFEIHGGGTTIQASKDLATMASLERYDAVRFDDSAGNVTHVRIRDLVVRTTATGTTANAVFVASIRGVIDAGNTMKDVLIEGNDVQTVAPEIGTNQKWYGIYLFDSQGVADTTRRLSGARIIGNFLDSSDGRNIQVVMGEDVTISANVIRNLSTGNTSGGNGVRILGTRNFSITGNLVHIASDGTAAAYHVAQPSGYTGNPASAYAERGTITGNTAFSESTLNGNEGVHLGGVIDVEVSGNTLVSTSATPTSGWGVRLNEDVNYPNTDVEISGNRIRGWESQQIRVDNGSVRTVISGNFLGQTAGGLNNFVQDLGTDTRYSGYEHAIANWRTVIGGIDFGADVNLFRDGVNILKTDDDFMVGQNTIGIGEDFTGDVSLNFHDATDGLNRYVLRKASDDTLRLRDAAGVNRILLGQTGSNSYLTGAVGADHVFGDGGSTVRVTIMGDQDGFELGVARDTDLYRSAVNTLKTDGALVISSVGIAIAAHLSATASLDFTALAANSCEVLTIGVANSGDGDTVVVGIPDALADVDGGTERTVFFGWAAGGGNVRVRRCNVTGTVTADPAAATVRVDVWRH